MDGIRLRKGSGATGSAGPTDYGSRQSVWQQGLPGSSSLAPRAADSSPAPTARHSLEKFLFLSWHCGLSSYSVSWVSSVWLFSLSLADFVSIRVTPKLVAQKLVNFSFADGFESTRHIS